MLILFLFAPPFDPRSSSSCELRTSYSKLIDFVKSQGAAAAAAAAAAGTGAGSGTEPLELDVQLVASLVAHFAGHWKADLEKFDSDVLTFFSNFRNGMDVLKKVLTQLLLYCASASPFSSSRVRALIEAPPPPALARSTDTRLQELIGRANLPPDAVRGIVSIATIMHEIKQHSRSFD